MEEAAAAAATSEAVAIVTMDQPAANLDQATAAAASNSEATPADRDVAANAAATDIGTSTSVCDYYVAQSGISDTSTICGTVDFSNPNNLTLFINVTWFPDDTSYYNDMISQTGFSAAQWTAFMDTSVATTFGSLITDSLATIATTYSCYGGVNCLKMLC